MKRFLKRQWIGLLGLIFTLVSFFKDEITMKIITDFWNNLTAWRFLSIIFGSITLIILISYFFSIFKRLELIITKFEQVTEQLKSLSQMTILLNWATKIIDSEREIKQTIINKIKKGEIPEP
jgi:hypothetical protein